MDQVTPAVRELATIILKIEACESGEPDDNAQALMLIVEKFRVHLSKLMGVSGFQALLARALALARSEADWLASVRVAPDAKLTGFHEPAQQELANAATDGSILLLARLLGLLFTFIGVALTLRLVQDIWTDAKIENWHSENKETLA